MNILEILILLILILFICMLVLPLSADFYLTMKYAKGWVWQERKGEAVKEFLEEKDGCINFIDVWDNQVKTCGIYSIERY